MSSPISSAGRASWRRSPPCSAHRLVTVHGPGGVGRPGCRCSRRPRRPRTTPTACGSSSSPACATPSCCPTRSPRARPARAGRPVRARRVPGLPARKRLLLIFDTCEHLLDACAHLIQAILPEAPTVTLLATSRQPLDTLGEHTFSVPPLPVPDSDTAELDRGDAVELFARRAAAAVPASRSPTATGRWSPAATGWTAYRWRSSWPRCSCARCHCASSSAASTPGSRCSPAGAPGALPRHQTLRTAIEWSYDLCSPLERALWQRLSVFAGRSTWPRSRRSAPRATPSATRSWPPCSG